MMNHDIQGLGHDPCGMGPRVLTLLGLAAILLLAGCQSPKAVEVSRPIPRTAAAKRLLSSGDLSPETKQVLETQGIGRMARADSASAVTELKDAPAARAELCLKEADRRFSASPAKALGYYLAAAEAAGEILFDAEGRDPERENARIVYNHSCGQVARIFFDQKQDWMEPVEIEGPARHYLVSFHTRGQGLVEPGFFDTLIPSEYLKIAGYGERNVRPGVGGALTGRRARIPERRRSDPFLAPPGLAAPVTATLDFSGRGNNRVELAFHDPIGSSRVVLGGRRHSLAADFTAPLAYVLDFAPKQNVGFGGMLHPEKYAQYMGLYQLEPIDSQRIPLVLVHGLMSRPETWRETLNMLGGDPVIRSHFQPFLFMYPTGFPIAYNAAGLRRDLGRLRDHFESIGADAALSRMILVGHSMGSNLGNMQIRSSGDILADRLFTAPVDQLQFNSGQREILDELVVFEANPDISRVVFICGPHRGSKIADDWIGRLGSHLINLPSTLLTPREAGERWSGLTPAGRHFFQHPGDSIDDLEVNSKMLTSILQLPMNPRVTYHSIIGKLGHGPLEDSSDGVVPYWSAHLDGADSEKIVPTSHIGATHNPGTVEELRRILYVHLGRGE